MYFVDEENNITLSTNGLMKTESHHRRDELININSFPWYQSYLHSIDSDANEFTYNAEKEILKIFHGLDRICG